MADVIDPRAAAVLDFWFGRPGEPDHLRPREQWFRKDPAFDAQIAQRFGPLLAEALRGGLAHWAAPPRSALAQIVVLDQFTRNAHRGSAAMFAGDALALAAARALVDSGAERTLPGVMRQFAYLPFEHAEDRAEQQRAMALFTQLEADEPALAAALNTGGTRAEAAGFPGTGLQGHAEINRRLGDPSYAPTSAVDVWLRGVFGG